MVPRPPEFTPEHLHTQASLGLICEPPQHLLVKNKWGEGGEREVGAEEEGSWEHSFIKEPL